MNYGVHGFKSIEQNLVATVGIKAVVFQVAGQQVANLGEGFALPESAHNGNRRSENIEMDHWRPHNGAKVQKKLLQRMIVAEMRPRGLIDNQLFEDVKSRVVQHQGERQ